jgi:hypothetical protein
MANKAPKYLRVNMSKHLYDEGKVITFCPVCNQLNFHKEDPHKFNCDHLVKVTKSKVVYYVNSPYWTRASLAEVQ